MKQFVTEGIILSRTDYGEADRIVTLLTPDHGKLTLMAKGVRRVKSKLAGGIELFSISAITFAPGRSGMGTLVSTRLTKHFGRIVQDLNRTMLGYELIKQLNKHTEEEAEAEYFTLLTHAFEGLDDSTLSIDILRLWFTAQLLALGGHAPNLQTDATGAKLDAEQQYHFDLETMSFAPAPGRGSYNARHIKFLRLAFGHYQPRVLAAVQGSDQLTQETAGLVRTMFVHAS